VNYTGYSDYPKAKSPPSRHGKSTRSSVGALAGFFSAVCPPSFLSPFALPPCLFGFPGFTVTYLLTKVNKKLRKVTKKFQRLAFAKIIIAENLSNNPDGMER
jgi:hypothetical protein